MSEGLIKKRPAKLKINLNQDAQQKLQPAIPEIVSVPPTASLGVTVDIGSTSTLADKTNDPSSCACLLDSKVRVRVNNQDEFLISPDNLTVVQQLGRGQYGIVEKVHHKHSDYYFAVKRVALRFGDDNERTRLLMDVDILVKGTECHNIIKFYGALIWEGDLWILMELMDCSLDKFYRLAHRKVDTPILTTNKKLSTTKVSPGPCTHLSESVHLGNCELCNPIPESVIGRIAADVVEALNYLYSIKVIHRDVKPSNILINKLGIIKLCDFGISGYLVNSVARTYEAGCRPYMAPERIDPPKDRTGYDIKSDVWSFGITLFEIATGRYPYFQARDFFEQLKLICTDEPPRLTKGRFTEVFEEFISQCLKKNYQDRPKYDAIMAHKFVMDNRDLDIREFTQRVLSNLETHIDS